MRFSVIQMIIISVCVFIAASTGFYYLQKAATGPETWTRPNPVGQKTTFESNLAKPDQFPFQKEKSGEMESQAAENPAHSDEATQVSSGSIDPNTATRETIKARTGLTDELVDALMLYREEGLQFKSSQDLLAVPGFTAEIVERIGSQLTFEGQSLLSEPQYAFKQETGSTETRPDEQSARSARSGQTRVEKLSGPGQKININTASIDELIRLPKIGPKTAERIVEYRQAHGPFQRPEQIVDVKGIGPKTYERLKDLIKVQD